MKVGALQDTNNKLFILLLNSGSRSESVYNTFFLLFTTWVISLQINRPLYELNYIWLPNDKTAVDLNALCIIL